jgi:hypothetical protein
MASSRFPLKREEILISDNGSTARSAVGDCTEDAALLFCFYLENKRRRSEVDSINRIPNLSEPNQILFNPNQSSFVKVTNIQIFFDASSLFTADSAVV